MPSLRADDDGPEDFLGIYNNQVFASKGSESVGITPGNSWVTSVQSNRVYVYEPEVGEVDSIAKAAGVTAEDVCAEMWEMIAEKMFGDHAEPGLQETLVLRLAPKALERAQKQREAEARQAEMERQRDALIKKQIMEKRDRMLQMPMARSVGSEQKHAMVDTLPYAEALQRTEKTRGVFSRLFNLKYCV